MDTFLIIIGFFFIILGIAGSFLPIIPGPITSWIGLLMLFFAEKIAMENSFLISTGIIALIIFILDNIITVIGAKKFGGGKGSVVGSTIGLIVGILFLGPFGLIIGPFLGAFVGELFVNINNTKGALKAATGSLIGFITGVFLKFIISAVFFVYFLKFVWQNREVLF